jgi:cytochrome P450
MLDANAYRKTRTVPDLTQLHDEGFTIIFAGANTVAVTMLMGSYHTMKSTGLLQRLRNELLTVWPDLDIRPALADLEKLPLLTATIKESLRFIPSGVSLTRIVSPGGNVLAGREIPGGTIIGMATLHVHQSEEIFTKRSSRTHLHSSRKGGSRKAVKTSTIGWYRSAEAPGLVLGTI